MSDTHVGPGDDLDLTAAEYVIGTLDTEERAAFAARIRSERAAAMAVSDWERRLAGLSIVIDAQAPPPEVWARIETALDGRAAGPSPFRVIEGGGGGAVRPDYRRSRDRWRLGALASGAVAACLAVYVAANALRPPLPSEPPATYVAAVNRGGAKPALLVRVDMKTGKVFVRSVDAQTPSGRSLELWYIADGKSPRSMGLVQGQSQTLDVPRGPKDAGATFAVSVEPPGGSKTGAPTGPVVYAGQLVKE